MHDGTLKNSSAAMVTVAWWQMSTSQAADFASIVSVQDLIRNYLRYSAGLLRQFFHKVMSFDRVTGAQVARAVNLLQPTAAKCLGYRSPSRAMPRGVTRQK